MMARLFDHGDFDAALEILIESMSKHKVPDFKTMKGFVEGLAKGGRGAEAKQVISEVKKKFPSTMVSGWKKLEKELGFCSDKGDATPQVESAAEESFSETEPTTAEALELEDSAAEETSVLEESADDEKPAPEMPIDEEVSQGPA